MGSNNWLSHKEVHAVSTLVLLSKATYGSSSKGGVNSAS